MADTDSRYLNHLDRTRADLHLAVGAVGLDAGCFTPALCNNLAERDFFRNGARNLGLRTNCSDGDDAALDVEQFRNRLDFV